MLAPRACLGLLVACLPLGYSQAAAPDSACADPAAGRPAALVVRGVGGRQCALEVGPSAVLGGDPDLALLQTDLQVTGPELGSLELQRDSAGAGNATLHDTGVYAAANDEVALQAAPDRLGVANASATDLGAIALGARPASEAVSSPAPAPGQRAPPALNGLWKKTKPKQGPSIIMNDRERQKKPGDSGSRWFDSGRNGRPGRKRRGKFVSTGVEIKFDKWGEVQRPRRKGYYFPVACLAFPGIIFALFHMHRSPWKPPQPEEPKASFADIASTPRSTTSAASRRGASKSATVQSTCSFASDRSRFSGSDDLDDRDRQDSGNSRASSKSPWASKPSTLRRRKTEYGFVDKMFLKHWNRSFGENAQLTVRGAALALIAGLPLIVPEIYFPSLQQFQRTGFWSVGAITLFIFTLWKTVGETLSYAWYGIFGTFMASIDIWIMFGLFPGGVTEVSPPYVFWVGLFNGVVFITIILWLNCDDNTKIFALMNFVWYWMAFLDPERADIFSQSFGVTSGASEISSLLAAVSGSGLAVTATLLPFPLWALGKACQGSYETVIKLGTLWSHAVDSCCCPRSNVFETDRLVRELMDLHRQMDTIDEHLRSSWWECFGLGSWQRVRLMVNRLTVVLRDEFDRLYCVLNTTLNTERADKDVEVFYELEDRIREVIGEARWLFQQGASAACRGGFTRLEAEAVKRGVQRVDEAVTTLTLDFREIKQESGGPKLSEGLLDEHAFCYNICALGRLSIKFTQDLLKMQQEGTEAHMPKIQESVGFWGVFDPRQLFDLHYVIYVVRTALRIFVCFAIGYHGYANVVRGKNAGIAIPATLLLMRYTGSAIQKNAKRLQAVVLGTVTGILIHAIVGRCIWWGYVLTGVLYFFWLILTLFIYFDTIDNSYSGLLMAYFGTMGILRGCNDLNFDPMLTHYPITNTVVAIFVVTFFDTIFQPSRASVAAYEAYKEVWQTLEDAVKDIFDPKVTRVQFHRAKIMALVARAAALGNEAAIEPRWWRIPWPTQTYDKVVQSSYQLCACLSNLEHTVAKTGTDGAYKDEVFQALLHVSAFQGLGSVLLAKMTQMERLLKIFTHETTGPMAELDAPDMLVGYLRDESEARRKFLQEVHAMEAQGLEASGSPMRLGKSPKERDVRATLKRRLSYNFQVDSLEADPASQVSLLLSDIEQMIRTMRHMHHTILRN